MRETPGYLHTRRSFLEGAAAVAGSWKLGSLAWDEPDPAAVRRVHVVFKTHLDLGYTDLARTVVRRYLDEFIPRALDLAETTRRTNPERRFRWTTGSWLIHHALEQADIALRARLEAAIRCGDIQWHALPFTLESEGSTASLMAGVTAISRGLDARFGRTTIAAKMTDVPGHTRSLVPHLARQGVRFLHVGVNPASSAPEVPSFCRWRAPDGSEILLQYHKEYYGGEMALPGGEVVTVVMMTNDNRGPQTPEAIEEVFEELAKKYPNARICSSTLDEIARELIAVREHLPVVTGELGDTWIHGFGSDPWKMSRMRQLSRLRERWLAAGSWQAGSAADLAFATPLLMVAEHTWGLNSTYTGHWEIQHPADLARARVQLPSFIKTEESWQEKRNLLEEAVASLPEEKKAEARRCLAWLEPARPSTDGFEAVTALALPMGAGDNRLALDPKTGAIHQLRLGDRDWAGDGQPLGLFAYQTFGPEHLERFLRDYTTSKAGWVFNDFGKVGSEQAGAREDVHAPTLQAAWTRREEKGLKVLVHQRVFGRDGAAIPGCPGELWSEWFLPNEGTRMTLDFQWFDKEATRLPEALWLSFSPVLQGEARLVMDKLGQEVGAHEVVSKGGRGLHAVDHHAESRDTQGRFRVSSDDAFLVSPGRRDLLEFDDQLPEVRDGQHWCLCNNTWGTNFVMWFDHDMRFRFSIEV